VTETQAEARTVKEAWKSCEKGNIRISVFVKSQLIRQLAHNEELLNSVDNSGGVFGIDSLQSFVNLDSNVLDLTGGGLEGGRDVGFGRDRETFREVRGAD